jgi:molybdopterin converting factor small subunit
MIAAGLGERSLEVSVPPEGLALSRVLALLVERDPRAGRYLAQSVGGAAIRTVVNDRTVAEGEDPIVSDRDELMLLMAVAGGT